MVAFSLMSSSMLLNLSMRRFSLAALVLCLCCPARHGVPKGMLGEPGETLSRYAERYGVIPSRA